MSTKNHCQLKGEFFELGDQKKSKSPKFTEIVKKIEPLFNKKNLIWHYL